MTRIRLPRYRATPLRGLATLLLLAALYAAGLLSTGNFHEVVAGKVYRSAQPTAVQLATYRQDYGIASVLNLRGIRPKDGWYRQETEAAAALGIAHIDFPMSASEALTPDEAKRLIAIMRAAPKPMLIHCKAGSDRTGLAAAFYLAAVAGADELSAEQQISITYGHFSGFVSQAQAMDETFERLEPWLGFPNS
ncbi:tyrosine-protein phosphatase [Rhizobium sp. TRM95111]|uniref:tyrosine-protein phosphatase n=1 Tax=Rhizobium alarense TaxID=2846851 RepID=UPI001F2F24B3|nr:tyrosine-protein phosphatase [Rhizobium alarense]MCF3642104.1 tyrosine-protein phosphatase [Rhizobium alarense]